MSIHLKINQSGRSMVEMLGVLAVVGVLSVGGLTGYVIASEKYRINKAISIVDLFSIQARSTFAYADSYEALGSYGINRSKIPSLADKIINDINSNPPYVMKILGNMDKSMIISLSGLSRRACHSFVTRDWASSGVIEISTLKSTVSTGVLTIPEAAIACDFDEDTGEVKLTFDHKDL